jgi:hypothetical protein
LISTCQRILFGKVWIVGSSIVKDAFIEARRTPGGVELGLLVEW